jgi:hypothetical protein
MLRLARAQMAPTRLLRTIVAVSGGLALAALSAFAQTQHCDPLPPPESGQPIYKARGNRCEGFYLASYGAQSIELVSLTLGPITFPLQAGVSLGVSTPGSSAMVHVRAVPKPPRMSYRMDATLEPGAVLDWPVNDVLLPENISAGRIGVFGWKDNENGRIYLPVRVVRKGAGGAAGGPIVLTIRLSFDAELVKWRSTALVRDSCGVFSEWKNATNRGSDAGQPVEIELTRMGGANCIEIAAKSETENRWMTEPMRLELPAR